MGFDGPGVQGFFEGFESGEFLAQVQRRHCVSWSGAEREGERGGRLGYRGMDWGRVVGDEVGLCDVAR
jgi:hypothetical protein